MSMIDELTFPMNTAVVIAAAIRVKVAAAIRVKVAAAVSKR